MKHLTPSCWESATRTKILRAAAEAFSERGFRSSTLRHIADLADINEITIYRYFPRKKDLFWETIDWKTRQFKTHPELAEIQLQTNPPHQTLLRMCKAVFRAVRRDPGFPRLIYFTFLELDLEKQQLYRIHYKPILQSLSHRIRDWKSEGLVGQVDPDRGAAVIAGFMVHQFASRELSPVIEDSDHCEQLAEECTDLCLHGLLGSSTTVHG
jgi:AcrR family transcriptional regulator